MKQYKYLQHNYVEMFLSTKKRANLVISLFYDSECVCVRLSGKYDGTKELVVLDGKIYFCTRWIHCADNLVGKLALMCELMISYEIR